MVNKVMALRHKVTVSTNAEQVQCNLIQEEERLRTSLRSSKGWRSHQAEDGGSDEEDDDAEKARLVDSADESDEFFDRTGMQPQTANKNNNESNTSGAQTYE